MLLSKLMVNNNVNSFVIMIIVLILLISIQDIIFLIVKMKVVDNAYFKSLHVQQKMNQLKLSFQLIYLHVLKHVSMIVKHLSGILNQMVINNA